jgi:hypothetical protein
MAVVSAEMVRASRDGDRFHYYWAACRALCLLDLNGDLTVIGVEGLPEGEVVEGEEVIDVAEYYGGRDAESCMRYRYVQLKHSTLRTDEEIVASELKKTLGKFAAIYRQELGNSRQAKLQFAFVANRKMSGKVLRSLEELAAGSKTCTYEAEVELLRRYMGFGDDASHEADFCQRFAVEDGIPGVADMELQLRDQLAQFLPGGGTGSEMSQMMERISRCATSLIDTQTLDASDVLVTLRTTEEELFPAPSAIQRPSHVIRTADVDRVASELAAGSSSKVLITAVGGLGKSVLASVLGQALPPDSVTLVYDCFAGGDYRKVTSRRHSHQVALTQLSNELAAHGLCTPLIPATGSDAQYTRVFMRRIGEAARRLEQASPQSLLTVVVDAADNAALIAGDLQQATFVTDLFRESWPANTRIVQLCRPERKHLLRIPASGVTQLELTGFGKAETVAYLRARFPDATEGDGAELHALSGGNPRVQAMAVENAAMADEALSAIRIARNTPGDPLDSLLARQVDEVADQGHLTPDELARLCEALATLPPPIPLDALADVTSLDADAIRSFAASLGRGLHAADNVLQFRDEPTETWFRNRHRPVAGRMRTFAAEVRALAATSTYVAGALPQLLFEAGMLDELAEYALSNTGLPDGAGELQEREIARARARFALSAMLRVGRFPDAALLAVKAGETSSGHSRKMKMFRSHPDLTAMFLSPDAVEGLCSSRELATSWPGSNLHVEAAMLSGIGQFRDLARSRRRSAFNNLAALLRLPEDDNAPRSSRRDIGAAEVADIAMAAANIGGPAELAGFLRRWSPESFAGDVASRLCSRLADAGRYEELSQLAVAGAGMEHVQLAVARTLYDCNVAPDSEATAALTQMLRDRSEPFDDQQRFLSEVDVRGGVWTLVHALRAGLISEPDALRILDIHLPATIEDHAGSRWPPLPPTSALLGHALRARLTCRPLTVESIASEVISRALDGRDREDGRSRDFKANVPGLLPWAECWLAVTLTGGSQDAMSAFEALLERDLKPVPDYNTPYVLLNGIAEIATRVLAASPRQQLIDRLSDWHRASDAPLARSRLAVARIACRSQPLMAFGLQVTGRGADAALRERTDSDSRVGTLIELARAVLAASASEAQALFDLAVREAEMVGDDLWYRWQALTNTAKALGTGGEPTRAYRLFQIAEELERADGLNTLEFAERLRGMHEATYLTAASRARDRRSLAFDLMVTPAFRAAAGHGADRTGNLSLYAFKPASSWTDVVPKLTDEHAAMATSVFEAFTRYEAAAPTSARLPRENPRYDSADPPASPAARFAGSDFTTETAWNEALRDLWQHLKVNEIDICGTCFSQALDHAGSSTATREVITGVLQSLSAALGRPARRGDLSGRIDFTALTPDARSEAVRALRVRPKAARVIELFGSWNAAVAHATDAPPAPLPPYEPPKPPVPAVPVMTEFSSVDPERYCAAIGDVPDVSVELRCDDWKQAGAVLTEISILMGTGYLALAEAALNAIAKTDAPSEFNYMRSELFYQTARPDQARETGMLPGPSAAQTRDLRTITPGPYFYEPLASAPRGNARFVLIGGSMQYVDLRGEHEYKSSDETDNAASPGLSENVAWVNAMAESPAWALAAVSTGQAIMASLSRATKAPRPYGLTVSRVTRQYIDAVKAAAGRVPKPVPDAWHLGEPSKSRWTYQDDARQYVFNARADYAFISVDTPPSVTVWGWPDRSDLCLQAFVDTISGEASEPVTIVLPDAPAFRDFARRYVRAMPMTNVERTLMEDSLYGDNFSRRGYVLAAEFEPSRIIHPDGSEDEGRAFSGALAYLDARHTLRLPVWSVLGDALLREVASSGSLAATSFSLPAQERFDKVRWYAQQAKWEPVAELFGPYRPTLLDSVRA